MKGVLVLKTRKFNSLSLLYLIPVFLFVVAIIAGCTSGADTGEVTEDEPPIHKTWTIMVYMAADSHPDNDLESHAWVDMIEMEQVGSTDSMNIIVQFDKSGINTGQRAGAGRYIITRLTRDNLNEFYADPSLAYGTVSSPMVQWLGNTNMGDPDTLVNFVKWGMQNYPANKYAIILWNHGSGWRYRTGEHAVKAVCEDYTSNDTLTQNQVKNAFDRIYREYGRKIEFLGMDACLMGMLEVAYDFKDTAKYFVGSSKNEPGFGWPYYYILSDLRDDPSINGRSLASIVASRYVQFYSEPPAGAPQAVSLMGVDLAQMDNLITKVNDFATTASELMDDYGPQLKRAWNETPSVETSVPDYKDLGNFTDVILNLPVLDEEGNPVLDEYEENPVPVFRGTPIYTQAQSLREQLFSTAVFFRTNSAEDQYARGLSIWLPDAAFFNLFNEAYSDISFGTDTGWLQFLRLLVVQEMP